MLLDLNFFPFHSLNAFSRLPFVHNFLLFAYLIVDLVGPWRFGFSRLIRISMLYECVANMPHSERSLSLSFISNVYQTILPAVCPFNKFYSDIPKLFHLHGVFVSLRWMCDGIFLRLLFFPCRLVFNCVDGWNGRHVL